MRASELRGRYIQFARSGDAARRIVQEPLGVLENSLKVRRKQLDALLDGAVIAQKQREEAELRARVAATPQLAQFGTAWNDIEAAVQRSRELYRPYSYLEGGAGFNSRLFAYARLLVRAADERGRPDGDRLREYTDTRLPRLQQQLSAQVPVYPELERLTLSFGLERMREWLGPDHAIVRRLLASDSPETLAARLVDGSRLGDPAVRLALWNGGAAAVAASTDPMIELARSVDAEARAIRTRFENEVDAPIELASERIARARYALLGTQVYPDATFTLRLNYGTVQAWTEQGQALQPFTRLQRAFDRATGQAPFRIPASWLAARPRLDPQTPFNLSTNNDVVGGNSGSALINAKGDVVGLVFDGNIHSISGTYWFDAARNRAVAVHPAIMREALDKVYGAESLLAELSQR
jgi:hypothetical protein